MSAVAFLVNPAAAAGRTRRLWPDLARRAADSGLAGRAYVSERAGQLGELAVRASDDGADLLVVVGGDGSLNEVASGLLALDLGADSLPVLAAIPMGTGRDFVRTFGIPSAVDQAITTARDGDTLTLDAGRVEHRSPDGTSDTSYFTNIGSAGISGAIAKRADSTTKALGGKVSFATATVSVFLGWKPAPITVTVDHVERSATMHDVMVANCRYLGGGMKACPEALPDDGLFDVLLLGNLTKSDLAVLLPKSYWGGHVGHPKVEILRGSSVRIDSPQHLPIQLDGQLPGTTPARFDVLEKALRVRVPPGAALR